ncbi:MAG: hypothetical protein IJ328_04240 [Muribaculaceae bacterium]|nr:hypothetical protein [Muribaculaceae bacterium]
MKMKSIKLYIGVIVAFMSLSFMSCNVHEWPAEEAKAKVLLHLDYNTAIDEYLTMYADMGRASRSPEDYDTRYIIKAYLYISDTEYLPQSFAEWRFTRDDVDDIECSRELELSPGKYKIMVWTDFVTQGTDTDKFYKASDFSYIEMTGEYDANNDFRDAFVGSVDLNVDYEDLSNTSVVEETVLMERPLAKYYFITTDVEEFTSRYIDMHNLKSTPNAIIVGTEQIDYSKLSLKFSYPGYLPYIFNMFTDRPIDSMPPGSVSYDSHITDITNEEATLGFDYVLVNGKESSVDVKVALYDTDGSLISMSGSINVPLVRGKYTIVKGKFFTQNQSGGVGIDPSFTDDINLWIP